MRPGPEPTDHAPASAPAAAITHSAIRCAVASDIAGQLLAERIVGYPASVATTWLLHYDELAKDEPANLGLLRLSSFLDPEDIDLGLVLSAHEFLLPHRGHGREDALGSKRLTNGWPGVHCGQLAPGRPVCTNRVHMVCSLSAIAGASGSAR